MELVSRSFVKFRCKTDRKDGNTRKKKRTRVHGSTHKESQDS